MEYGNAAAAAVSRELTNGHGRSLSFGGKGAYDGTFAAPARRRSSVVDYAEIFGGSGSSIPILHVPELQEESFRVDVRKSALDYSEVFGGLEELGFAGSHDEWPVKPWKRSLSSSEEWDLNKPGNQNHVCRSGHPSENQLSSPEASYIAVGTTKQFKMSYNQNNPQMEKGISGTACIAELSAVPGYTHIIDETLSLPEIQGTKQMSSSKTSIGRLIEGEDFMKEGTNSPQKGAPSNWRSNSDGEFEYMFIQSRGTKSDLLQGECESDCIATNPRKPPHSSFSFNLSSNNGTPLGCSGSNLGLLYNNASIDANSSKSPPYIDEETDANSAAAVSAAAVKKAIEQAQARLKVAKEMMERKKEGFDSVAKPGFGDGLKAKKRRNYRGTGGVNKSSEKYAQEFCEALYASCQSPAQIEEQGVVKAKEVNLDLGPREELCVRAESCHQIPRTNSESADNLMREKAERNHIVRLENDMKKSARSENQHGWEEQNNFDYAGEILEENGKRIRSVKETFTGIEVLQKLGAVHGAHDSKECLPSLKSADDITRVTQPLEYIHEFKSSSDVKTRESIFKENQTSARNIKTPETNESTKPVWNPFLNCQVEEQKEAGCLEPEKKAENCKYRDLMSEMEANDGFGHEEHGNSLKMVQFREEYEEECRVEEDGKDLLGWHHERDSVCGSDEVQKVGLDNSVLSHRGNDNAYQLGGGSGRHEFWSVFKQMCQTIEIGSMFKQIYQPTEIEKKKKECCGLMDPVEMCTELCQRADSKKVSKSAGSHQCYLTDSGKTSDDNNQDENVSSTNEAEAFMNNLKNGDVKATPQELVHEVNSGIVAETDAWLLCKTIVREPLTAEVAKDQQKTEVSTIACLSQSDSEVGLIKLKNDPIWVPSINESEMVRSTSEIKYGQNQHDRSIEETCTVHAPGQDAKGRNYQFKADCEEEEVQFEGNQCDQHSEDTSKTEETCIVHASGQDAEELRFQSKVGWENEEVRFEQCQHDQHAEIMSKIDVVGKNAEELSPGSKEGDEEESKEGDEEESKEGDEEESKEGDEEESKEGDEEESKEGDEEESKEGDEEESKEGDAEASMLKLGKNQYSQSAEYTIMAGSATKDDQKLTPETKESDWNCKEIDFDEVECNFCLEDTDPVNDIKEGAEELSKGSDWDVDEHVPAGRQKEDEKNGKADHSPPDSEDGETVNAAFKLEVRQGTENMDDKFKDEGSSEHSLEDEGFHNRTNFKSAESSGMSERDGPTVEEINKDATEHNTENQYESLAKADEDTKRASHIEVEPQYEQLKKIDETKAKEKEREKERIMVERAIREARERAFAEARERAEKSALEKSNAESRRKVQAESRGRSEKVPVEVIDKSSANKVSAGAKLRAERAAVERALAEARERALEKALSEKAATEARRQAEKSFGSSRDNDRKQGFSSSDKQCKVSGPNKGSNQKASSSSERPEGANGESAQRCKARLERHQRTAERAAKALAEKKMRDFIAQKEQSERHRLAETLDAEVRRWSNGKEGNLRALLSTLHYILKPESGWKPIPLTDLVSAASVKKAYRKATLHVHPDKLQQRGASTQQKYICEKVFDLLKDAWNKFSMEER